MTAADVTTLEVPPDFALLHPCTHPDGHDGWHVAGDGRQVVGLAPNEVAP